MINIVTSTLIVIVHFLIKASGLSIKELMIISSDDCTAKENFLAGCLLASVFLTIFLLIQNITLFPLLLLIPIYLMKPFSPRAYLRKLLKGILEDDQ